MPGPKNSFIRVQCRVSQRANPALYEHLKEAAQQGESPNTIVRRLAEEALMLRRHPIIQAIQVVDLKGEKQSQVHNTHGPVKEQDAGVFQYTGGPIKEQATPQRTPPAAAAPVAPAPRKDGGSAMAALVVQRGLEPEQRRR